MSKKFTGITSAGSAIPVYDKDAHEALSAKLDTSALDDAITSAVSGKADTSALVTTEVGAFTIPNNTSGGPIKVIVPTDDAPLKTLSSFNDKLSAGYIGGLYGTVVSGIGPGGTFLQNNAVKLTFSEPVTGIAVLRIDYGYPIGDVGYYNGPSAAYTNISYDEGYRLPTEVVMKAYSNPAGSPYGQVFTIGAAGPDGSNLSAQLNDKLISMEYCEPDPSLGVNVDLNRFYVNAGSGIAVSSDETTKKQTIWVSGSYADKYAAMMPIYNIGISNGSFQKADGTIKTPWFKKLTSSNWSNYSATLQQIYYDPASGLVINEATISASGTYPENGFNKHQYVIADDSFTSGDAETMINSAVSSKVDASAQKSVVAGDYITITENADNIEIAASGVQPELTFSYDGDNAISAINGSALAGGGVATGDYVPLSAANVSIGNANTAATYSFAQGYQNKADGYAFAQSYKNSASYTAFAQGGSNSAETKAFAQGYNNKAYNGGLAIYTG